LVERGKEIFVGGLTGLLTAYQLKQEGKDAIIIEKGEIGSGATHLTTAFLTQIIDTDFSELISLFGSKNTQSIWTSHGAAIDLIENISKKEKINCDFLRCPAFFYAHTKSDVLNIAEIHQAAKKIGVKSEVIHPPLQGFKNFGGLKFENQAQYHPLKFLYGLAAVLKKNGTKIFENTAALDIKENKIYTKNNTITVNNIIIATHKPFKNRLKLFAKKGEYISYAFEIKMKKGTIPAGLYWDLENPYDYFRVYPQAKFDQIIFGGQDHRSEIHFDETKRFEKLKKYVASIFPKDSYTITKQWNGPIIEPFDGIALIGQVSPGEYHATGYSGNGMTYAGISALLLADMLSGRKNSWATLYDPNRIPSVKKLVTKGRDYTEELINIARNS
jgi:glycine/D-amino acid oxidase-like deaminating enzyme